MKGLTMKAIRKIAACMIASVLLISSAFPAFADDAGTLTKQNDGSYLLFDGTKLNGVVSRGIDVSHWQGTVDWKTAAKNDVSFAMLGTRYKGEVDPLFQENARNASAAGIRLGIYLYSYAMTPDEASAEADFVLNLIKDYPVSYPVAYDVEDETTQGTLSKAELTAIIKTFCEKIRAAGYYPILYANDYWLINKLDMSSLTAYPVWVASYYKKHAWTNPVMWQATSTGSIDGIDGNVDIDLQYKSFADRIPADTWRNISGTWYYYKNYSMQKNTFINDGKNSYFMKEDGTIAKDGWYTASGKKYYLDPSTGVMTVGWKKTDGSTWNYFGSDGNLSKGWIQDGNLWYYLDAAGAMKSGWLKDQNKWYLLGESGAMKTGWQKDGDVWYFLGTDGAMQTGVINQNGTLYDLGSDGKMLANTSVEYNGEAYTIDGSGAMTKAVPTDAVSAGETASPGTAAGSTGGSAQTTEVPSADSGSPSGSSKTVQPAGPGTTNTKKSGTGAVKQAP